MVLWLKRWHPKDILKLTDLYFCPYVQFIFFLLQRYNKAKHCPAGSLGRTTKQLKDCTWARNNVSTLKVNNTCTYQSKQWNNFLWTSTKLYSLQEVFKFSFEKVWHKPWKNIRPMFATCAIFLPFHCFVQYRCNVCFLSHLKVVTTYKCP